MQAAACLISTTVNHRKVYIKQPHITVTHERSLVPIYTADKTKAHICPSSGVAEDLIKKLKNPVGRTFIVEPIV